MCMMQDPIQNCICNDRIIKYIIPRIKIYICCQNGASFFISQIYQLEEQFCIIFFNWQITRFINDQQLIFKKVSQSGFQTVFQFGFLKLLYQIMTLYKVSAVSFFAAAMPIEVARCVFPTPLEPRKTIFSAASKKRCVSKSLISCSLMDD